MSGVRQAAVYDDGRLLADDSHGFGERRIRKTNRAVARGVTLARYRRHYLWVKTIKPALAHLRWSYLKKLRPAQVRKALAGLFRARKAE